jgi:uncharacterized protein (TIGR03067 family)
MRVAFALAILLASTPLAMVALADATEQLEGAQAEMKRLAGTWEGYAVEGRGERPDRGPVHLRLIIDGDKISAVDLGSPDKNKDMGKGAYKLDPGQELKQIDATGIVLPGKREKTYPGIYELDGDTLKWCVDNRAKERPAEFRTIGGKYLLILKRQK